MLAPCAPHAATVALFWRLARYDWRAAPPNVHLVTSAPGIFPLRPAPPPPGCVATVRCALAGARRYYRGLLDARDVNAAPSRRGEGSGEGSGDGAGEGSGDVGGGGEGKGSRLLRIAKAARHLYWSSGDVDLELRPQPGNPHDANAVAVWMPAALREALAAAGGGDAAALQEEEGQLGCLPREVAAWVRPFRDLSETFPRPFARARSRRGWRRCCAAVCSSPPPPHRRAHSLGLAASPGNLGQSRRDLE